MEIGADVAAAPHDLAAACRPLTAADVGRVVLFRASRWLPMRVRSVDDANVSATSCRVNDAGFVYVFPNAAEMHAPFEPQAMVARAAEVFEKKKKERKKEKERRKKERGKKKEERKKKRERG